MHEMLLPVFWEKIKKKFVNMSSADFALRVVSVKPITDND